MVVAAHPQRAALPLFPELCASYVEIPSRAACTSSTNNTRLSPFPAALTSQPQPIEKSMTLSPLPASLTGIVFHNPFVCHSYKKEGGWHTPPCLLSIRAFAHSFLVTRSCTHRGARKPVCFHALTSRFSEYPGVGVPHIASHPAWPAGPARRRFSLRRQQVCNIQVLPLCVPSWECTHGIGGMTRVKKLGR